MKSIPNRSSNTSWRRPIFSPGAAPAFTLVELLVVVVTLGLLSALLIPTMAGARADNWRAQCQSQMKQLGLGVNLFASDRNDMYPPAGCADGGLNQLSWDSYIHRYIDGTVRDSELMVGGLSAYESPVLLRCPADTLPNNSWAGADIFARRSYAMVSVGPNWAVDWQIAPANGKYILPRLKRGVGVYWSAPADWEAPSYRTSVVRDPGATLLLVENPNGPNLSANIWPCITIAPAGTSALYQIKLSGSLIDPGYGSFVYKVHGSRFNYLFHDGHTEALTIERTTGSGTTNAPNGMWTVAAGD